MGDAGEHGGLVIETFELRVAAPANPHGGPFRHSVCYVSLDDLELARPEEGPHVELSVAALAQSARALHDLLDEGVRHRLDVALAGEGAA